LARPRPLISAAPCLAATAAQQGRKGESAVTAGRRLRAVGGRAYRPPDAGRFGSKGALRKPVRTGTPGRLAGSIRAPRNQK
jgi:hypothetical protein